MTKKAITPGLYFFHNHDHVDGGAQMTGSNLTLTWAQLEPYKNQPDYARIDAWVAVEEAALCGLSVDERLVTMKPSIKRGVEILEHPMSSAPQTTCTLHPSQQL